MTAVPAPVNASTHFQVYVAGEAQSPPGDTWSVFWKPLDNSGLTPAGLSALVGQAATYLGALGPVLPATVNFTAGALGVGSMSVQPGDAATQQAAVAAILASPANVVPDPSSPASGLSISQVPKQSGF